MGMDIIPLGPASGTGYFDVSSSLDTAKPKKGGKKGKSKGVPSGVPTGVPSSSSMASGLGVGIPLSGDALRKARKDALRAEGLLGTKKKYESKEARKAAAKLRAADKRAKKRAVLESMGLGPKPKQKYASKEERKAASKLRRIERRRNTSAFVVEMAKENPELAQKHGIDLSKFKLFK